MSSEANVVTFDKVEVNLDSLKGVSKKDVEKMFAVYGESVTAKVFEALFPKPKKKKEEE